VLRHAISDVFLNLPSQVDVVLRALPGAAQPGRDLAADVAAATHKAVNRL